jgi:predicted nucleic acid-binding protein
MLTDAAQAMFAEDFAGRVLAFGAGATARCPGMVVTRRRAGNPIEGFDALIAATAPAAGASVATRDSGGFSGCGLTLIDPWTAP